LASVRENHEKVKQENSILKSNIDALTRKISEDEQVFKTYSSKLEKSKGE